MLQGINQPMSLMDNPGRRQEDRIGDGSPHLEGIVAFDLTIKAVNAAWERLLGYPREVLLEKSLTRLVDQNEHAAVMMLVSQRTVAGEDRQIEFSFRCRDGTYRCFVWERRPLPGRQAMQVTGKDITERKKMETTANLQRYMQSRSSGSN
jgi:PAS domain S-box-containing protein